MQSLLNNNYISEDNNSKGNETLTTGAANQLRHKNIDNIHVNIINIIYLVFFIYFRYFFNVNAFS